MKKILFISILTLLSSQQSYAWVTKEEAKIAKRKRAESLAEWRQIKLNRAVMQHERCRKIAKFIEQFMYADFIFTVRDNVPNTTYTNAGESIKAELLRDNKLTLCVTERRKNIFTIKPSQTIEEQQPADLHRWNFRDFSREIFTSVSKLDFITDLTLNGLDLSQVTAADIAKLFASLKKLKHLNISACQLSELPHNIGSLEQLTHLDVSRNEIAHLPTELGNLTKLKHLNVSANTLTVIPREICDLKILNHLDFRKNLIQVLPEEFSRMTQLGWLWASDNRLKEAPNGIAECVHLQGLFLDNNELTEIPDLGGLSKLALLSISNNRLKSLPASTLQLPLLEQLFIYGNPFVDFGDDPTKVGATKIKAFEAFLRKQMVKKNEECN